jgi:hypothetical protein
VFCIYTFVLLVMIDLWFERDLAKGWKIAISVIFLTAAGAFSWAFVFVEAALPIAAIVTDAEYATGTDRYGVKWRKEFTELQVIIANPSDRNYDDLNLLIRPTEAVTVIKQISSVPNVSFVVKNNVSTWVANYNLKTGKATGIPAVLVATDAGYTMQCPRLPARSEIKILFVLANIKNPAELFTIRFEDFSTYWVGNPDGDVYAPRPMPRFVIVEGEYNAALRTRGISKKVDVSGKLPPELMMPGGARRDET